MKKSFAQLKRDLQVGTQIKTTYHLIRPERVGDIREISRTQTNGIAFKTIKDNGEIVDSWLWYPKTSSLIEYEDNTFKVFEEPNNWNDNTRTLLFTFEIIK